MPFRQFPKCGELSVLRKIFMPTSEQFELFWRGPLRRDGEMAFRSSSLLGAYKQHVLGLCAA
jgi:hypothetical protein